MIFMFDTSDKEAAFPRDKNAIQGSVYSLWFFKPLDYIGDVPQTAVTFIINADLGGKIPIAVANRVIPKFVSIAHLLRLKFDKSEQIEAYERQIEKGEKKVTR